MQPGHRRHGQGAPWCVSLTHSAAKWQRRLTKQLHTVAACCNRGKGPGRALAARAGRPAQIPGGHEAYARSSRKTCDVKQAEVVEIAHGQTAHVSAVTTRTGAVYYAAVLRSLPAGTYLDGRIDSRATLSAPPVPMGMQAANGLTHMSCEALGLSVRRFKTGTPAKS